MRTHHLASLLIPPLCSLILGGCTGGDASSSSTPPASPPQEEAAQEKGQESEQKQKPDYEQMIKEGRAFSPAITSSTEYSTTDCDEAAPEPMEDSLSPEERRFTVECILKNNQEEKGIYEEGGNVFWKKPDGTVQQITKTGGQTGVGGCKDVVRYIHPTMSTDSRFVAFVAACGTPHNGIPSPIYLKDLSRNLLAEITKGEIAVFMSASATDLRIYDRGVLSILPPYFDLDPFFAGTDNLNLENKMLKQILMNLTQNILYNASDMTPTKLAPKLFPYEKEASALKFQIAARLIETFAESKLDSITDVRSTFLSSYNEKYGALAAVEATVAYTKRAQKMERDGSVSLTVKTFEKPITFVWKDFRWHLCD